MAWAWRVAWHVRERLGRVQVADGRVRRDAHKVRVLRGGKAIFEGRLRKVRVVKQDVEQVDKGGECGLMFDGFEGFEVGDVLEAVELQRRRPKTASTETGAAKVTE
jgi:translation initiation factor IF-2